jgi:hypothetical protein
VLAACREGGIEELLDTQCEDLDEWEALVDGSTAEILKDR